MLGSVIVKLHPHRIFLQDTIELSTKGEIHFLEAQRVAPGIFRGGHSSDEGAKTFFLGYCKCQKSPKK